MLSLEESRTAWTDEDLRQLNDTFRTGSPQDVLAWAATEWGQQVVLTCSFGGAAGMVLLDMVMQVAPSTPVVFLDTGLLFPETYAAAEAAEQQYGISIIRRRPRVSLAEQERQEGPMLYARDPDRCCHIRKVVPLGDTLRGYDAWISGIRRDQSSTRASTPVFGWNARHKLVKISPLAFWTERDVWRYIHANNVPYNALLDQGYSSIGCAPCTRAAGTDAGRSGRWAGFAKTECGIHV